MLQQTNGRFLGIKMHLARIEWCKNCILKLASHSSISGGFRWIYLILVASLTITLCGLLWDLFGFISFVGVVIGWVITLFFFRFYCFLASWILCIFWGAAVGLADLAVEVFTAYVPCRWGYKLKWNGFELVK